MACMRSARKQLNFFQQYKLDYSNCLLFPTHRTVLGFLGGSEPAIVSMKFGYPDPGPLDSLADGFPKYWTEIKPSPAVSDETGDPIELADVALDDIPAKWIAWH